jgi:hypothetical protein
VVEESLGRPDVKGRSCRDLCPFANRRDQINELLTEVPTIDRAALVSETSLEVEPDAAEALLRSSREDRGEVRI